MNQYQDKKIKVLFILPSLKRAGAETQVVNLMKGFNKDCFEIFIFTFDKDVSLSKEFVSHGIKHFNYLRRHKFDFSMIPKLTKVIDEYKIDVIHTSLQIALFFGWIGKKLSKRKPNIVHALHKMVDRNVKETILEKLLFQWPMRSCRRILCVCHEQQKYWISRFPYLSDITTVIYNGVNTDHFKKSEVYDSAIKLRKKYKIPEGANIVACIAAFRAEKNHLGLIDAFSKLNHLDLNPYLLLAGDGPEKSVIEKLVNKKKLKERVIFLGNIQDVRPLLAIANLSVLFSTKIETFSIAMLESMSMCCPVISTDIGGHKEAITNYETGYIVPVGEIEEFRTAISLMLEYNSRLSEMGVKARRQVKDKFSEKIMVECTEMIVKEVYHGGYYFNN